MISSKDTLFLLGTSHKSAPLEWREHLAVKLGEREDIGTSPGKDDFLKESLLLRTCNRVELYGVIAKTKTPQEIEDYFAAYYRIDPVQFSSNSYLKHGQNALAHLFQVSTGLDSQIIGEAEILGQVKKSYGEACERRSVGPVMHRTFQKSFQMAKWIRTRTDLGRGHVTIGSITANLAERVFGNLENAKTLVVGSGEVGAKTAKALRNHGARSITVSSPTLHRAELLASEVQGDALPYSDWPKALSRYDVIILCTSSKRVILSRELLENALNDKRRKPLFVVDLSVPRNVDASASTIPEVYLFDLIDLATIAKENMRAREGEVKRCLAAIRQRSQRLWFNLSTPTQQIRDNFGQTPKRKPQVYYNSRVIIS